MSNAQSPKCWQNYLQSGIVSVVKSYVRYGRQVTCCNKTRTDFLYTYTEAEAPLPWLNDGHPNTVVVEGRMFEGKCYSRQPE
jgi:hypothetical protein